MSAKTIYDRLRSYGMTIAGACAMLGNMQAESGLKANIAQRGMTTLTDDEYTRQADSYAISQAKFVHDAVGYGLCQWTYWSRKKALVEYAHDIGKSVGDEAMQVDFCIGELKASYASLWSFLCTTEDTYEATSRICTEYERPAVNNINTRYGFAQKFQAEFADGAEQTTDDKPQAETYWPPRMICEGMSGADVAVAQALLAAHGAELAVSSVFDAKTKNRTMEFQNDVGLHADGIIGNNTWTALLRR